MEKPVERSRRPGVHVALNLRLHVADRDRLKMHALVTGDTVSNIVTRLVAEHIPEYRAIAGEE